VRFECGSSSFTSGDLAAVALSELETTLLQRQLLLIDADRELAVKAENLLFFWPQAPSLRPSENATLRTLLGWPYRMTSQRAATVLDELESHPELRKITAKIDQNATNEELAKNQVLPELDLEFKVSKDIGGKVNPLSEGDAVVGLNFGMPIGQRAARARQQTISANLRSLKLEKSAINFSLLIARAQRSRRDSAPSKPNLRYSTKSFFLREHSLDCQHFERRREQPTKDMRLTKQ